MISVDTDQIRAMLSHADGWSAVDSTHGDLDDRFVLRTEEGDG